jgi:cob(I)alamin adenosyltransferase
VVRLTRIYTRLGDGGDTHLGDMSRVRKTSARVVAYGDVDELNAAIGVARAHGVAAGTEERLALIQNDLFDLGADLCRPEAKEGDLRIVESQVIRLEREIDKMNAALQPLQSFVLPGGVPAAAYLHLARTITRRAERAMTGLAAASPVNPEAIKYINRLSDHLFVLSRYLNGKGKRDVLWQPGANR